MTTAAPAASGITAPARGTIERVVRRNAWGMSLLGFLALLLVLTKLIHPGYGAADLENLARASIVLGLAASAQAIVVIAGGIDLSIGAIIALTNVTAAVLMAQTDETGAIAVVAGVLLLGLAIGAINGILVVATRVADIIVTLATSFIWSGCALLVLSRPGGGAATWLRDVVDGSIVVDWLPKALIVLLVVVGIVWLPLRRSRTGLALYAVGSHRLAAFRSGVNVNQTKILSYMLCGLFAAAGGLALTASTGIGTPTTGTYTLAAVAAIVLGGVSLAGGQGGLLGPIVAAFMLALIRVDLVFLGVDPNYSVVVQGVIMVVVVMIGGLITLRRQRT